MKKVPKKYGGILLGISGPIVMGFIISFVATAINLGFVENFVSKWMQAYLGVLAIGVPVGFVVIPPLTALIDRIAD